MKRTINGIVLEAEYGWGHTASGVEQFNRNFARLHFGLSLPEVVDWFYKLTAEQLHAEGKNRAEEHGIVQAEG
ncbi:hypothetical protein O9H85_37235 [Paenibacillus filicis]|uniref:Uncharacterized protein n=1 Tax=Paenibacillus gyeongsangnamensis TaxID=3388067 RepID=A0ABT4QLT1_9BACL|nr:hypothetical protein [Paenibacillus filicis]MCZ8517832.1 hypothetical protein [Paenibacillus filicis]